MKRLHLIGLLLILAFCFATQAFAAKDEGCRFTRISPVPEGKAVIYMYKVGYGRSSSFISVNEKIETVIKKPGYYPMVVSPGTYKFELGSGFGWIPLGHPVFTIDKLNTLQYLI